MAIDMMVDSAKLDREMLATANALREKGKTEAEIPWEDEIGFEQAVLAIKGGGDLNFEVVGGTTRPTNPKENTIWVNTSTAIPGWSFSAEEPANPVSGMVWIETKDTGTKLNALSENEIVLRIGGAYQYISGSWEKQETMLYSDGKWNTLTAYLYKNGDLCEDITGGWDYQTGGGEDVTFNSDRITVTLNGKGGRDAVVHTVEKINISEYSRLCAIVTPTSANASYRGFMLGLSTGITYNSTSSNIIAYVGTHTIAEQTLSIDLKSANLSGKFYVTFHFPIAEGHIHRVWLE